MSYSEADPATSLELTHVVRTARRHLKLLVAVTVLAGAVTVTLSLLSPRRYSATLSASTISGTRGVSLGAGLQAALAGAGAAGLQPTPALITRLAQSRQLIVAIARGPSPRPGVELLHLINNRLDRNSPDYRVYAEFRRLLSVASDRETGLVTLSITHRDSAVARYLALQMVAGVTRMFREAARTQAAELRMGQQRRVDSTASQLANAEESLRRFTAANRYVAPFSEAALTRDRLTRAVSIAQTVYSQVVTDRESAITKELEETPAVIVVDPLPRELVPQSRNTVVKAVLAAFAAFLGTLLLLLIRSSTERPAADAVRSERLSGIR